MGKTLKFRKRGGKKTRAGKIKCWSKKTKQNKRYVVCSGSKGQKKRRSRRLRNKKQKGGTLSYFMPTELNQLWYNTTNGVKNIFNTYKGKTKVASANPLSHLGD